jgi:hypothetical protein
MRWPIWFRRTGIGVSAGLALSDSGRQAAAAIVVYLFRDHTFAHSGAIVCVAERPAVEAVLGCARLEELFQGRAVYTNDAIKQDYLGVWGNRNAARLRRFLRECGADVTIVRGRPADVRLRYFSHDRRAKLKKPKLRNLIARH